MFDRPHARLAPLSVHISRVVFALLRAGALIVFTLGIGVLCYHWIAGLAWIDSLHNASMILGGMGPVDTIETTGGKLFASMYALFSGLIFVVALGFVVAPILHRALHRFHLEDLDAQEPQAPPVAEQGTQVRTPAVRDKSDLA